MTSATPAKLEARSGAVAALTEVWSPDWMAEARLSGGGGEAVAVGGLHGRLRGAGLGDERNGGGEEEAGGEFFGGVHFGSPGEASLAYMARRRNVCGVGGSMKGLERCMETDVVSML